MDAAHNKENKLVAIDECERKRDTDYFERKGGTVDGEAKSDRGGMGSSMKEEAEKRKEKGDPCPTSSRAFKSSSLLS